MSSQYEYDRPRVAGSGEIVENLAGATIANRDICYLGNDGRYYPADSDAAATMPVEVMALAAMTAGQNGEFLVKGFVGLSTWTWTTGSELYASGTVGGMSHTAGTVRQQVGMAYSATQIFFDPKGIDTTGAATAATREFFYGPPNADSDVGDHAGQSMADGIGTYIRRDIFIPHDFTTITRCDVIVVQSTAANPNMVWTCNTDWGAICAGEDYLEDSDSTNGTSALLQDDLVCLEISAALTGIAAGDLVGVSFYRDGANGADTVGGNVYYLGIRLRYT